MAEKDPRIDAYIEGAAPFAQPILRHIRAVVHAACPDVEEEMKWSFPHFYYKGVLFSMAAFKEHCALRFWKASLVLGEAEGEAGAMGQFGRIARVGDLPSKKALAGYVKKAMALNDAGVKPMRAAPAPKGKLVVPPALLAALKKDRKALAAFEAFPPSHKREYADWIADAKGEDTRARRVKTAVAWIAEGRSRNWKYERPRRGGGGMRWKITRRSWTR